MVMSDDPRQALIDAMLEIHASTDDNDQQIDQQAFSDLTDLIIVQLGIRGFAIQSMGTWTQEEIDDQKRRAEELAERLKQHIEE